ncbi:hypothetical protein COOONC_26446 [Cooperia oncophora]
MLFSFPFIQATSKSVTSGAVTREAGTVSFDPATQALLNECGDKKLNDCDPSATCMDNPLSYECLCRENFLDVSPDPVKKPGRKCIKCQFFRESLQIREILDEHPLTVTT